MAHITTLQSGIYTYMDVYAGDVSAVTGDSADSVYEALFAGGTPGTDVYRVPSVREFPSVGNTSNISNVPVYGQKQSAQVSGQSDAPTLDMVVNYVAADMADIESLKGQTVAFRFMLAAAPVTEAEGAAATLAVENTEWYWIGKIESVSVSTSLTDSVTATVSISATYDFVGPSTLDAA